MIENIELAFIKTIKKYHQILNSYYPSHNGTGFTERNLTNNFVNSLELSLSGSSFSWFEAPLSASEKKHLDAVVFHADSRTSFSIEAKRISNPSQKINSIKKDLVRMKDSAHHDALEKGLQNMKIETRYAIVLADVWLESKSKKEIYENWPNCLDEEGMLGFKDGFNTLPTDKIWKNNYKILAAAIKI